ncbi:nicotinamide-nucleotide adenylyltransferase, NadR type [Aquiflexum balticum DSM 16537]|uniref:Nicotinamide-nucleotide adenylyltransferase, NadR type n=1 Tax=Aquiflexum balticum DSM 16537 TaxID=758820 RepID=A0A1W2H1M3_9BACT|nr:ATP-binding protein [Aquiflexum balticum]SMD42386.1 nicotinamide-nucleotide adenylyltransferase, NadR type [Aquiflexum balticum DSM 16537]
MPHKIVVIGPESTGKSTLSKSLAEYFNCPWVPEYARNYLEKLEGQYTFDDLLEIAKGQIREEETAIKKTENLLICDTDLHVIKVWSQHKFGKVHSWVEQQITDRKYDLYLLTDIDIPWENDPQREHPEPKQREYFLEIYRNLVIDSGIPYQVISGSLEERRKKSIEFIEEKIPLFN